MTIPDVYYGRGQSVLDRREKIELETLAMRKQMHYDRRANQVTWWANCLLYRAASCPIGSDDVLYSAQNRNRRIRYHSSGNIVGVTTWIRVVENEKRWCWESYKDYWNNHLVPVCITIYHYVSFSFSQWGCGGRRFKSSRPDHFPINFLRSSQKKRAKKIYREMGGNWNRMNRFTKLHGAILIVGAYATTTRRAQRRKRGVNPRKSIFSFNRVRLDWSF